MGKRFAEAFTEDDYFAEPDYDRFTDEELDQLYNFGHLPDKSSGVPRSKTRPVHREPTVLKLDDFDEQEMELDDYLDLDLYDDE